MLVVLGQRHNLVEPDLERVFDLLNQGQQVGAAGAAVLLLPPVQLRAFQARLPQPRATAGAELARRWVLNPTRVALDRVFASKHPARPARAAD